MAESTFTEYSCLYRTEPVHAQRKFHAIGNACLFEDSRHFVAHALLSQIQTAGDLPVAISLCNQFRDTFLRAVEKLNVAGIPNFT